MVVKIVNDARSNPHTMSSFSSVIKKPGAKVAPKVAPRRNIVRKVPQPSSTSNVTPTVVPEQPANTTEPETLQAPQEASVEHVEPHVPEHVEPQTHPAEHVEPQTHPVDGTVRPDDDGAGPQTDTPTESSSGPRPDGGAEPQNHIPTEPSSDVRPDDAAETQSNIPTEYSSTVRPDGGAEPQNDIPTEPLETVRTDEGAEPQNDSPAESSVDATQTLSTSETTAPEPTWAPTPNWPAQKDRPERNTRTPNPPPRPTTSSSGARTDPASPTRPSSSTSHSSASPETPRSKSKRKQPPRGSAQVIPAQPAVLTPPTTQPSRSPTQERPPSVSQRAQSTASQRSEAEEALDRINAQLQRVGDIAAAIARGTPAPDISLPDADDIAEHSIDRPPPRKRRKKDSAVSQAIQDQAAEVVANAMGHPEIGPHRRRNATPEDAEEYEIEEESTTMFDLCDEKHKYGKTSEIEKQMKANWQEILKRRKEDAAERLARNMAGRRGKNKMQIPEETGTNVGDVPDLVIQDGQIVVSSREIDRQAATSTIANAVLEDEVRDDTDIYKRINSSTVGPSRSQIAPGQQWDDLSTDLFYQGLKMFGTDFKMISNMIPGKNRRQVKLKYNAEERSNWAKVQRCLSQKQEVNLDAYATMTGLEFGSVSDVYKKMEDDEKQLREEDERRRREEGIISQQQDEDGDGEADVPLPSIEGQDGEAAAADADGQLDASGERQSTTAASRVGSTVTGRHTAQPQATKKKQQSKKSTTASKKGRQANAKSKGFEGVEERLGDATEISIPGA